jgi:AcrR family transcriptional regulator
MKRLTPKLRKTKIVEAATAVAIHKGYCSLTRAQVAKKAKVSETLISHYFKNIKLLKQTVLKEAIKSGNCTIILQGLTVSDPLTKKISPELKREAYEKFTNLL